MSDFQVVYEETSPRSFNTGDNNSESYSVTLDSIESGYIELDVSITGDDPFGESTYLFARQDVNNEYEGAIRDNSYTDFASKVVGGSAETNSNNGSSSHTNHIFKLEFKPT